MATQAVGYEKIVDGPSKFDMLLGQYDSPREIKFWTLAKDGSDKKLAAVSRIQSSTLLSVGRWLLIGWVKVGGPITGEHYLPMYVTYDPQRREGEMVINPTGKGAVVLYFPAGKNPMFRLDLGAHKGTVE